ncbi:hypothetical protein HPB49_013594 [Dermacentor silvarum]|uniref:Uncharacterized protein n=1 Tax=Dermacentor silvarum TaxID=543639 RepID=A0ACB8D5S8_DERSI|nr:hypothetical protein HPB49_013594 [Dermacentor silvarum]
MVVCASCGGEDFEEVSGLFYCSECNTQSQEVRVEQVDDEGAAPPPHVGRASPRQSRKETGDKPQESKRHYQTNELTPRVVCRLWMDYLVKLEAVSRVEGDERTPRIGAANRWSDLRTVEELLATSESNERKRKKLQKALFGVGSAQDRCVVARARNLDSECEDVLEEEAAAATEGEQASDDEWEDFRSTAAKSTSTSCPAVVSTCTTRKSAGKLRWARDGHLPYLHVMKLLPQDAKLWGQQWRTFVRLAMPTIDELSAQAAHLAHFLGVRNELKQPPLLPIVMRLVADLNLPLEFVNVCEQFFAPIPTWEKQLSQAVEELASRHPGANLFGVARWEKHMRARVLLLRSSCYIFEPKDLDDIRDVGVLVPSS